MYNSTHGGDIFEVQRLYGIDKEQIIDFSSNINPLGLPASAKAALKREMTAIGRYPDPQYTALKNAVSEYCALSPEQVFLGNGATEIIHILPSALKIKRAALLIPTFSEYEAALRKYGAEIEYCRFDLKTFDFDFNELARKIKRVDAFFLCNPNNPSSTLIAREKLEALVEIAHNSGTLFIVDESFMDFIADAAAHTLISQINKSENLIVLKSYTKFFGMPGLRVGSAAANESIIKKLEDYMWPWNINNFAAAACAAVVKDDDFVRKTKEHIQRGKAQLASGLNELNLNFVTPSANFILFETEPEVKLKEKLILERVLIRDCGNIHGLRKGYYRISVKTAEQNRILLNALRKGLTYV